MWGSDRLAGPCQLQEPQTDTRRQVEKAELTVATEIGHATRPIRGKTAATAVSLGHTRSNRVLHGEGGATMSEPWLSAEEIAAHLGVTKDTVYAWIADKAMPAHKIGRLWKFQASEVDSWVRSGGTGSK